MDIMRLLAERRTFRRFAQTPIPADVIADVIEAVRLSSCGANRQALRLVIADQASDVSRIHPFVRWAAYLPPDQGTPQPGEQPTLYVALVQDTSCLLYTSPSPRDATLSRMPSSA